MKCPNCGKENREQAKFCNYCGKPITKEKPAEYTSQEAKLKQDEKAEQQKEPPEPVKELVAKEKEEEPLSPSEEESAEEAKAEEAEAQITAEESEEQEKEVEVVPQPSAEGFMPLVKDIVLNDSLQIVDLLKSEAEINTYHAVFLKCRQCDAKNDSAEPYCNDCGGNLSLLVKEGLVANTPFDNERKLIPLGMIHPCVAQVYKYFEEEVPQSGKRAYLAMEEVSGVPLSESPLLSEEEAILLRTLQLSEAVEKLHDNGVYGAGLEPERILIDAQGIPKIVDFQACSLRSPTPSAYGTLGAEMEDEKKAEFQQQDLNALGRTLAVCAGVEVGDNGSTRAAMPLSDEFKEVLQNALTGKYKKAEELVSALREADEEIQTAKERKGRLSLTVGKASDVGKVRDSNEDSLRAIDSESIHKSIRFPLGIYVVADGMGGHSRGEVASKMAIHLISKQLSEGILFTSPSEDVQLPKADSVLSALRKSVQVANSAIYEANAAPPYPPPSMGGARRGENMGTTITTAVVIADTAYIANVGDSRTYLFSDKGLKKITEDHSLISRLIAIGMAKPEELYTHPRKSEIYRSLGGDPDIEVDTFVQRLKPGDCLMLCSDGLWEMVRDEQLAEILRAESHPQTACAKLIQAANENGGEDNIAVIIVKLEEASATSPKTNEHINQGTL
jgi:protein phosphatase